jgi:hypothetical protein
MDDQDQETETRTAYPVNASSSYHHAAQAQEVDPNNVKSVELDAIKLRISKTVIADFENPYTLQKEIRRCKQPCDFLLNIKFADINRTKAIVIIATDDQATHDLLSKEWPKNAFHKGAFIIKKNETKPQPELHPLIIRKVHRDIEIESWEATSDLEKAGLRNAKRIYNKNKEKTDMITVQATSQEAFENALKNGVYLGLTRHRLIEPELPLIQCHRCQGFGHRKFDCVEKEKCAKCTGEHHFKNCTSNEIKCANCGKNHWSFARRCAFVQNAASNQIDKFMNKANLKQPKRSYQYPNDAPVEAHSNELKQSYASVASKKCDTINRFNFNEVNLTKLITKVTSKIIEEQLKTLANKVMDVFIYAINETLGAFDSEENPILKFLKNTLEQNLMSKSKKEIAALAKEYGDKISQNQNPVPKTENSKLTKQT